MRKLNVPALVGTTVAVYRNHEWNEYVVKIKGQGDEAWAHDDDKDSAIGTAVGTARRLGFDMSSSGVVARLEAREAQREALAAHYVDTFAYQ
jgi:hypothetical protein